MAGQTIRAKTEQMEHLGCGFLSVGIAQFDAALSQVNLLESLDLFYCRNRKRIVHLLWLRDRCTFKPFRFPLGNRWPLRECTGNSSFRSE